MRLYLHSMRRPRHPLARFLSLLLGLAVIGVLLIGGVIVLAIRQWKQAQAPAGVPTQGPAKPQPAVLEGEFRVIRQGRPVTH